MEINTFQKKKNDIINQQVLESHMKMRKVVIFVKKNFIINMLKIKNIKLGGKYKGGTHSLRNLKYSVPEKIPIVFHNRSNYHYHFIITS